MRICEHASGLGTHAHKLGADVCGASFARSGVLEGREVGAGRIEEDVAGLVLFSVARRVLDSAIQSTEWQL